MPRPLPRIPPIEPDQITDEAAEFFAKVDGPGGRPTGSRLNVIRTLAQHPELAVAYFEFGRYILNRCTLSARIRELATLRTAWLYGSDYEWVQHAKSAERDGMSQEEIEAIKTGFGAPVWSSDLDRVVLRATDQLIETKTIDDEVWSALAAHLDHRQIMDVLFTVGCYATLAMALNAIRVAPEMQ